MPWFLEYPPVVPYGKSESHALLVGKLARTRVRAQGRNAIETVQFEMCPSLLHEVVRPQENDILDATPKAKAMASNVHALLI